MGSDTIISFLQGKRNTQENHVDQMKVKIDSALGKENHALLCDGGAGVWHTIFHEL